MTTWSKTESTLFSELTVPPHASSTIGDYSVFIGQPLVIPCGDVTTYPSAVYSWYRVSSIGDIHGMPVTKTGRITIDADGTFFHIWSFPNWIPIWYVISMSA